MINAAPIAISDSCPDKSIGCCFLTKEVNMTKQSKEILITIVISGIVSGLLTILFLINQSSFI